MMNKKQKFYCYSLTETASDMETEASVEYIRENVQSTESFSTAQEAFEAFLKKESYDAKTDTEISYQTSINDDLEVVSLGFSRLLKEDRNRPSQTEIYEWKDGKRKLMEHTYSIIIFEFESRPLELKTLKKLIKSV